MRDYTWKGLRKTQQKDAQNFLLEKGGSREEKSGPLESTMKYANSVFSFYSNGTIYVNRISPDLKEELDQILGISHGDTKKQYLIGLDEAGKGEIIGNMYLTGTLLPKELVSEVDLILGSSDTKKKKSADRWDNLFRVLDAFRKRGLIFETVSIQPYEIDRYNLTYIMDRNYILIIRLLLLGSEPNLYRIVLDDYGIGKRMENYLVSLESQGAEVILTAKADQDYAETRLASVLAKRDRELSMDKIRSEPMYQGDGFTIGSGNASDEETIKWIEWWKGTGKPWPWFVRTSFSPISEIDRKDRPQLPPLTGNETKDQFIEGTLSVESISIFCPQCGIQAKSAIIALNRDEGPKGICVNCKKELEGLMDFINYYSGVIVPDSSIIIGKIISKDLNSTEFFKGCVFVLLSEVMRECDRKRPGKQEIEALGNFSSLGAIRLIEFDTSRLALGLDKTADEKIIETARRLDAVIYTKDKGMSGRAQAQGLFVLRS